MKSDCRWGAAALVALSAVLSGVACGGASVGSLEGRDAAASQRVPVVATDDGRLAVQGPIPDGARWVHVEPRDWPLEVGPPPVVGVGEVGPAGTDGATIHFWAIAPTVASDFLVAVAHDTPDTTTTAKHACRISDSRDQHVRLSCGEAQGVTAGDLYFVVSPDVATEEVRAGARFTALLRVNEVEEAEATARVEHARVPVADGAIAAFAQASFDLPTRGASILVAPFERGTADSEAFPAIADALPEYLAEFGLTNVSVEAYHAFLDPRPYDAAETAGDSVGADRTDYGAIVFGELDGDTLVFNATGFGSAPHPATTVGILPGGLPLPVGESIEALSRQLAPSFLATVLALRGDHALAAYFLETVLATEELEPAVRYHLREHLALRYSSLDRPAEALAVMGADIEASRAAGDVYPLLNALSIRSLLADEAGLVDLWVSDTAEFLEVATGVLPSESLDREHLYHARSLATAERVDEALAVIDTVLADARATDDASTVYAALVERAYILDDPAASRLALAEVEAIRDRLVDEQVAFVELLDAELSALMDDADAAQRHVRAALERIADADSVPVRAAVYRRAAGVFARVGAMAEATTAMEEAVRLLLDTAQVQRAAYTLIDLAFLQLDYVSVAPHDARADVLQQARQNLLLGAELTIRLGRFGDGAQTLAWSAALERQLGQFEASEHLLDRAEGLALAAGDYMTLYQIYTHRGTFAAETGDVDAAAEFQARALLFARAAGIEVEGSSVGDEGE